MAKAPNFEKPASLGQVAELAITGLAYGGDGVASLQGYTLFVPFAVPGDTVRAEVREVHKTYGRARLVKVLQPGPARIQPACPVAGECGGCSWQQLDYPAQLQAKRGFVRESLARLGGFGALVPEPAAILPSPQPLGYRNKALLALAPGPAGEPRMGFFASGSHRVVPLPEQGCAIQAPLANRVLRAALAGLKDLGIRCWDERNKEGHARNLLVRTARGGSEALLLLVTTDPCRDVYLQWGQALLKACPGLLSVMHNHQPGAGNVVLGSQTRVLAGEDHLVEELGGFRYRISADTFFQVNPSQTARLVEALLQARAWRGDERVLELYCGAGTLSFPLASRCGHVHGFESNNQAVEDARHNQELNHLANLSFYARSAVQGFPVLEQAGIKPEVLVLDPPRKGMEAALLEAVLKHKPAEILYVSCDPASLARDLGALVHQGGYGVKSITPVDMFPQTYHVESVTHLVGAEAR